MSALELSSMYELWLGKAGYPELLSQIPGAPKHLYIEGGRLDDFADRPFVGVVGSRKLTDYGREVTKTLVRELSYRGAVIVSGLALGVDSIAHMAALEAGGTTIAVLPSTLDKIYPASHRSLARRIIKQGGALVTEYGPDNPVNKGSFVARNRIISGLCQGIIIPEAAEKSGSLHTANFALEQGREVMAVPGSIFSHTSKGTNSLLKNGATPVTSVQDILDTLKLETLAMNNTQGASADETVILQVLRGGETDTQTLFEVCGLPVQLFNQTLSTLEITGRIHRTGQNWSLS